ncbi:hypothetical protein BLNAU_2771 [Blattamonas nauphoetae]|uniref:Uncharacterized protein n=1 Tax=Blattamonas nauphoetae TaxID=2049346 RepID=A0ABQ9YEB2_9EUKA|nr:hypothetical protein BLNAU_2771 [Blattamonas nauphoetae]
METPTPPSSLYSIARDTIIHNPQMIYQLGTTPSHFLDGLFEECEFVDLERIHNLNPSRDDIPTDHLWKQHCMDVFNLKRKLSDEQIENIPSLFGSWRKYYLQQQREREERATALLNTAKSNPEFFFSDRSRVRAVFPSSAKKRAVSSSIPRPTSFLLASSPSSRGYFSDRK